MPDIGYTGSQGEQGPPGNIGFTGSRAYTGSQGFTGSRGFSGWVGSRGYLGWVGSRGFLGYHGSRGWTGSRGLVGFVGSYGPIGYTGSRGAGWVGSRGIQGLVGYTGSRGAGWTGSQGITGFTGSMGWLGYTGSAGAGYTGSIGGPGPIGYTGSQGIPGRIAVEVIIVGETNDANTLPETANTGETWLVNDNFFIYHTDQWWDIGPARGPAGYVGSQGPQGLPSMLPNYLGSLIDAGELPDANTSANNDAFTAEGHLWMYRDTEGWMDLGAWEGRAGYTGSQGYVGSRGPMGNQVRTLGNLEDIVDRPDANTLSVGDAYVIGSDYHFVNETNEWVVVANFIGPVGPIGYTGSRGPLAAANAASGANGAIQFANNGIMTGASNFTINDAGSPPTLNANGQITVARSGSMLQMQQSSNNVGRVVNFTNEGLVDGYTQGLRARFEGSGGTTGVMQLTSADGNAITIAPSSTTINGTANLTLSTAGASRISLTGNTSAANVAIGNANTTVAYVTAPGTLNLETGNGVRISRAVGSSPLLTIFYPDTTSPVFAVNGTTEMVTLGANVGLSLGSATAPAANDLSRHLALYGTSYGLSVTSNRLNVVTGASANVTIVANGTDTYSFDSNTGFASALVTGGGFRAAGGDSAATPGLSWANDPDTGIFRNSTNQIGFASAGVMQVTVTNGGFFLPGISTGAGIALLANTGTSIANRVYLTASSLRYKRDIEDLDANLSVNFITNVRPVWYRSACEVDNQEHSYYGFIAEEVAAIEPRLAGFGYLPEDRNEDGSIKEGAELVPESVYYDRMVVPLIQVVQQLLAKNADLEDRLAAVESQLGAS